MECRVGAIAGGGITRAIDQVVGWSVDVRHDGTQAAAADARPRGNSRLFSERQTICRRQNVIHVAIPVAVAGSYDRIGAGALDAEL